MSAKIFILKITVILPFFFDLVNSLYKYSYNNRIIKLIFVCFQRKLTMRFYVSEIDNPCFFDDNRDTFYILIFISAAALRQRGSFPAAAGAMPGSGKISNNRKISG